MAGKYVFIMQVVPPAVVRVFTNHSPIFNTEAKVFNRGTHPAKTADYDAGVFYNLINQPWQHICKRGKNSYFSLLYCKRPQYQ